MFTSENRSRSAGFGAALVVIAMLLTLLGITAAGAQTSSCTGDTVLTFNVRLLNQPGNNSAGPYVVDLKPGIYSVKAASFDEVHDTGTQQTQPNEQWLIRTDTGWESPPTLDIPDDGQTSVTIFGEQSLPSGASSITLHHRGIGGVNSVDPVCVGFTFLRPLTPVAPTTPDADPEDAPDPGDSSRPIVPADSDPADPPAVVPDPENPVDPPAATPDPPAATPDPPAATPDPPAATPDPPAATPDPPAATPDPPAATPDPPAATPDPPAATPDPPAATPDPPAATPDPEVAAPTDDPDSAAPDDDPIEPEVEGAVETPDAGVLARTGPTDLSSRLLGFGLLLIGLGGLLAYPTRRTA